MHFFLNKREKALAFCNKSGFCRHFVLNENRKNLASCRAARFMKTAHPIFPHDIFKKSDLLNAILILHSVALVHTLADSRFSLAS